MLAVLPRFENNITLTIYRHKCPIHLSQPLAAVLHRLSHVMAPVQLRVLVHQTIDLDPHSITSVVRSDALESLDNRTEPVRHVHELLLQPLVGRLAGEPGHVLEAGAAPVIDDEEGEERRADGVKPPGAGLCSDKGEQQREGIEVDVRLAVLGEGLDLGGLDSGAADPDNALEEDGAAHCADGDGRELGGFPGALEKLLRRLLQDLRERDDHYDTEDEDAEGFETAAADGEALVQGGEAPLDEAVGGPDDEGAEEVEGGVEERGDEGEGAGVEGCGDFGDEEDDVGDHVDVDGPARFLLCFGPLLLLFFGEELPDVALLELETALTFLVTVAVVVGVHGVEDIVGEGHD